MLIEKNSTMANRVYAVIVTYNGMQWLDRCLGSLDSSETPVNTIVIDNASTDGTPDYIAEHFLSVHLVRSDINYGFAKANNIGIRYALDNGADYVFLLNQDAWVEPGTISKLMELAQTDYSIGIVSPMHMNGSGDALDFGFSGYVPGDMVSDAVVGQLKPYYKAKFVNAAAWLMKRTCIEKVGGFDTAMFVHYGEDSNYCQRLEYHGFTLMISTQCKVFHDRAFRKEKEKEYRQKVFHQSDVNRRLEYANILYPVDVDGFIAQNKMSRIKSYIKLKFAQAERLKKEIAFLETVKLSRETNMAGGPAWL